MRNIVGKERIRASGTATALTLCLLIAACGSNPPPEPKVPIPVMDPAPVSVGVYYGDALRNHSCTGGKGYIAYEWTFEMGPPSIEMFDGLLAGMFRNAETVTEIPEDTLIQDERDTVEIRMTNFTGCDASWPVTDRWTTVEVGYEAILRSAQGEELTRWRGQGTAGMSDPYQKYMTSTGEAAYLAALASIAMRKAATDFVVNFEGNPVVQSRLYASSR